MKAVASHVDANAIQTILDLGCGTGVLRAKSRLGSSVSMPQSPSQKRPACLRTGGAERISEYPYVPFFPQTRPSLEQHLPLVSAHRQVFERAGLQTILEEIVTQQIAADYIEYCEKIAVKADSIWIRLSDSDFDAGMNVLRSYANSPEGQGPVTEPIDLIVFRKN
jgi:hypothetical protein